MDYRVIMNSSKLNTELYNRNESFPPSVIIETTNYCNLKCSCCGHKDMKRSKGFMNLKLYKKLVDEIKRENPDTDIWMVFYGEPLTLRYKMVYLIDYAKKSGLRNVFMNTNALLLDEELSEAIIDAKLDKVVFSLDAFYKETYEKIRVKGDFDKAVDNIIQFIEVRNRLKSDIKIEVQLIELPGVHQKGEIEKFKKFWKDKGVETKIKPYVTWTGAINIEQLRHEQRYPCSWLFRTFVATWNGDVVQCGCDYDGKYIAGNVNCDTIKNIWQGSLKSIRDLHLESKYKETPICANCNDWDSYILMPFLTNRD